MQRDSRNVEKIGDELEEDKVQLCVVGRIKKLIIISLLRRFISTLILVLLTNSCIRLSPDVVWVKTYGGKSDDHGDYVINCTDGGYFVLGRTFSFGAGYQDIWLLRLNEQGDTLWTKTYGGPDMDSGSQIVKSWNGNDYYILGHTQSYGQGENDIYLIRIDSHGDTIWTKTYGGKENDIGWSLVTTSDSCLVIAGVTKSFGAKDEDVFLLKVDGDGEILWSRFFGGKNNERAYAIKETTGGFILCGMTNSFGSGDYDVCLIKVDDNGETLWTKTFGGEATDQGLSLIIIDGGCIVVGFTESYGQGEADAYLIRTDSCGDTLWTRVCGGNDFDKGNFIKKLSDGNFLIVGYTRSYGTGETGNIYLFAVDNYGNVLWEKNYGGLLYDYGNWFEEVKKGEYIISGSTSSFRNDFCDVLIIKVRPIVLFARILRFIRNIIRRV